MPRRGEFDITSTPPPPTPPPPPAPHPHPTTPRAYAPQKTRLSVSTSTVPLVIGHHSLSHTPDLGGVSTCVDPGADPHRRTRG